MKKISVTIEKGFPKGKEFSPFYNFGEEKKSEKPYGKKNTQKTG